VNAKEYLERTAELAAEVAKSDVAEQATRAAELMAATLHRGGKIMFCGNGGSAADAQHLAAELVGRMTVDRMPFAGIALTTDTSALTALGNDYGFEDVFARQVRALARPGDTLICISTSGKSPNVLKAAEDARALGVKVIALLGPAQSVLDGTADIAIHLPGGSSGLIQQGHLAVGHLVCALAEQALMPDDA
jgi:D-sedoheptulose 7-phosphate isomerase